MKTFMIGNKLYKGEPLVYQLGVKVKAGVPFVAVEVEKTLHKSNNQHKRLAAIAHNKRYSQGE